MYDNKYKDINQEKQNEEPKPINDDKQKEKEKFTPVLDTPKEKKEASFKPILKPPEKEERHFVPSLGKPKEVRKDDPIPNTPNLSENKVEQIKKLHKEEVKSSYNRINNLTQKLNEYLNHAKKMGKEKISNFYPNHGLRITNKFIDWLKKNENDPNKLKYDLEQVKYINDNNDIQEMIKSEIVNTNKSLKAISSFFKDYGLNLSPPTIKNIALKQVYKDNPEKYSNRFPSGTGGFLQENYTFDKENITYNNIELLKEKFIKYHEYAVQNNLKIPYANRGAKITNQFIKWIRDNEKNIEKRNQIIKSARLITKMGEIPQLAIEKTINTSLSLREISNLIIEKGFYLSHHAIAKYSLEYAFQGDLNRYNNRFPKVTDLISEKEEIRIASFIKSEFEKGEVSSMRKVAENFGYSRGAIKRIAEDVIEKTELDKIWIPNKDIIPNEKIEKIREEVKNYYPKSIKQLKNTYGVSEKAISRIAKEENTKEEYERKWPAFENIPTEIKESVLNDIKFSNLNQTEIADKYGITRHSVRRYAKDEIYKNGDKAFNDRFPRESNFGLGTETHKCILDELTKFFNINYDEKFFSEPKIYPKFANIAADGLILNNTNFLQKRLKDPNNGSDLSLLIHGIPSTNLDTQFDHIKAIQFDFTNDISDENIIRKCSKYQDPNLMTYIVGTRWYPYTHTKQLPNDKSILFPDNLKVIDYDLFAELIGLHGEAKDHYDQIIELNYNEDIEALKQIHERNDINWNHTRSLKEDLIGNKLIKKKINEYFGIKPRSTNLKQKKII